MKNLKFIVQDRLQSKYNNIFMLLEAYRPIYLEYKECFFAWLTFWMTALANWWRVLHALIYRETRTSWGEHSLGIFWAFFEPISHILVLAGLKYLILGGDNEINVFLFFATGLFPFFLFRNTLTKIKSCIDANRALLVFSQIKISDFIFARAILELATYSCAFFLFTVGLYWFSDDVQVLNILSIINGFLLMWMLGVGGGILLLPINGRFKFIDEMVNVFLRAAYFVSGIFFSFSDIPSQFSIYLEYNALFHGVEYVRSGFSYVYGAHVDISYILIWISVMTVSGLLLVNKHEQAILNIK
ncbi:MAG: ABC transporter permease [Pseudomonadota bacterium]